MIEFGGKVSTCGGKPESTCVPQLLIVGYAHAAVSRARTAKLELPFNVASSLFPIAAHATRWPAKFADPRARQRRGGPRWVRELRVQRLGKSCLAAFSFP